MNLSPALLERYQLANVLPLFWATCPTSSIRTYDRTLSDTNPILSPKIFPLILSNINIWIAGPAEADPSARPNAGQINHRASQSGQSCSQALLLKRFATSGFLGYSLRSGINQCISDTGIFSPGRHQAPFYRHEFSFVCCGVGPDTASSCERSDVVARK